MRLLAVVACLLMGLGTSYGLYAAFGPGSSWSPGLLAMLGVSSLVSLGMFAACRRLSSFSDVAWMLGVIASYVASAAALFLVSWADGTLEETLMWSPFILMSGIPFMAPIVLSAGVACVFIFQPRPPE